MFLLKFGVRNVLLQSKQTNFLGALGGVVNLLCISYLHGWFFRQRFDGRFCVLTGEVLWLSHRLYSVAGIRNLSVNWLIGYNDTQFTNFAINYAASRVSPPPNAIISSTKPSCVNHESIVELLRWEASRLLPVSLAPTEQNRGEPYKPCSPVSCKIGMTCNSISNKILHLVYSSSKFILALDKEWQRLFYVVADGLSTFISP